MVQINLVPDVKLELIRAQRHRNIVISTAILVMIASVGIVVLLGVAIGYQAVRTTFLTGQIKDRDEEFRKKPDIAKMVTIQNQLKSIQATHEQKAMTSRIFDVLLEATAKDTDNSVTFNSFTIDSTEKTISLVVQTDKRGFDAAEVFRKNIEGMQLYYIPANKDTVPNEFKSEPVLQQRGEKSELIAQDVSLSDLAYSESDKDKRKTVSFRLTFTYNPLLFDETIDILRIRGLARGNVTDSYKRLPGSLFESTGSNGGQ
ncbi:hypothetical protein I8H83_04940 [Candidatus Saccharibacteria bacterium]|nr:hypothetical protein [Candidatus Saccharibacteria bacterium]